MKRKESKQEKKEKLTESLHLTLEMTYKDRSLNASLKQNHCRIHKVALNENLPTFSTVSSFIVQFNKSQFRRLEGYFAVTKEIVKIVNSSQAYNLLNTK